ncbi:Methyltransf-25 domain-containing protein [Mycena chlorophos]|uniref:Methyltransf-25 domain-containing protein n=1 Tax=Mycena chlorophos TaxID=658473 RepID=A0A8H6WLG8_MYCCL|nr:Methyltransf-25 domain-containing protein [Mycena chlorophos]
MVPPPPHSTPAPSARRDSFSQNAQREVQAVLLKQRPSRRRPGDVPYPLKSYPADLINYDNWNQMFFKGCFGGLTAHKFEDEEPPQTILDLGCGGGNWALEMAQQYPEAHVVGFDLHRIQPELLELDAFYMRCLEDSGQSPKTLPIVDELANRVEWIHGNLLDGLPFISDYFDFVHISGISMGVPEDEWQFVLEEVCRVLRGNGILEIVEDDLIFPCAPPRPARRSLALLNLDFTRRDRRDSSAPASAYSSRTSSTLFSDLWSIPDTGDDTQLQKKPSLPTLPESNSTDSPPRNSIPFDVGPPTDTLPDLEIPAAATDYDQHPQDHQRLKSAWESMLSRRFLAASVTTVLPFYLSTFFENVRTHATLQIPLPQGSMGPDPGSRSSSESFGVDMFDLNPLGKRAPDVDMYSINSRSSNSSHRLVPSWERMHLAKTVATVKACKEAIWEEYRKLYPTDLPPIVPTKTARATNATVVRAFKNTPREAFETDWSNWENDMADRMSMRPRVHKEFGWNQPEQAPEAQLWQSRMSYHRDESSLSSAVDLRPSAELCRSLRAFIGRKPMSTS